MTSIAILEAVNTSYVPFNGQQIITSVAAGVTYVAMRQIVENIGIDWTGQSVKLRKMRDKFNCRDISMVAADGKIRKLLCIPLKKINGWLFSINPGTSCMETKNFIRFELSATGNGTSHFVWGGKLIIGGLLMLLGFNVKVMQNIARDELIDSIRSNGN